MYSEFLDTFIGVGVTADTTVDDTGFVAAVSGSVHRTTSPFAYV